jgi:hypothetical protein
MSLATIWTTNPDQLRRKHIQQIISFAGDGRLRDESGASAELREFLELIPLGMLQEYAEGCLQESFPDSGLALQDIVNEVGRRLDFEVETGLYRGSRGRIGFDAIWRSDDGRALIVEVKTTDVYRIELATLDDYRKKLITAGGIAENASSILIVVGRAPTGDLEAQVRGSRYAWNVRLISVRALLKLLDIKVKLENPRVVQQIRSILSPQEYTRVDDIIDLVFLAADDVTTDTEGPDEAEEEEKGEWVGRKPVDFNGECVVRIEGFLGRPLVKQTRVTWKSPDGSLGLVCKTSRTYTTPSRVYYWFAIHSTRYEAVTAAKEAWLAFGCGSAKIVLLIPYSKFLEWTGGLNITTMEDGEFYWHVRINDNENRFDLRRKKGFEPVDLTPYLLQSREE